MGKVLLIDFDNVFVEPEERFPNLPLMKLSAHHKAKGDQVFLNHCGDPDKVYVSCIFSQNGPSARGITKMYRNVEVGGSGISLKSKLPDEIDHICPDYDLYPNMDYSMGFTSRGCVRRCGFCIVHKKEKWNPNHADLDEFLRHDKLVLLDNNLTASPRFKEILTTLTDRGIRTNFNQGLDIRLITEEKAGLLADVKARDIDFKGSMLYFAWDSLDYEQDVKRGIDLLLNAGIRGSQLSFYILMAFDTTLEQDEYRALKLHNWGVVPYAQLYNNGGSPEVRKFARKVDRKWIWYAEHPRPTPPSPQTIV